MTLQFKSWQAQDYYNEYTELKLSLLHLINTIEFYTPFNTEEQLAELKSQASEKAERLNFILQQLELHGVPMKTLVLLGCGINVDNSLQTPKLVI